MHTTLVTDRTIVLGWLDSRFELVDATDDALARLAARLGGAS